MEREERREESEKERLLGVEIEESGRKKEGRKKGKARSKEK